MQYVNWWNIYISVVGFSVLLGIILTPVFRKIALMSDFVDRPKVQNHKAHSKVTPLLGGFAMCLAWLLTLLVGYFSPIFLEQHDFPVEIIQSIKGVFEVRPRLIAIIAGAVLITILGALDDKYNMSAKIKMLGQLTISAFAVYYGGFRISLFILNPILSYSVTVLWLLIIINAINFFDNMDGLAVGLAAIAFVFFALTAIINNNYFVACMSVTSFGVAISFWFYNHTPATIFMGDSGSHFLGYTLGISGAMTTYYNNALSGSPLAVLIPVFILAIPLFDFVSVIIIRIKIKKPIYIGDNNHLSHRFNKMGLSRKNAVLMVHLLAIIIGLSVLPLLWGNSVTAIISLVQACLILIFVSILQYSVIFKV